MEITTTGLDYESNIDFGSTGLTGLENMNTDTMMGMGETFAMVGIIVNIISILLYISQTTGLFLINKKLGEKHAWLSFIPLLQIYNYFTASKKGSLHYFWLPIIAVFIGAVLAVFTFGISLIIAYIYALVMWIKLLHAISLRCGRGTWTTIGFIFVPFIMMPVVGCKLGESNHKTDTPETKNVKEKIEL